jgi:hypothetical protein
MGTGERPAPLRATERRWGAGGSPLPRRRLIDHPRLPGAGFDLSAWLRRLCQDVVLKCPTFAHIDPAAVAFTATTSRTRTRHGLLARVTPLRFRDGTLYRRHRGTLYQVQRFVVDGREVLYVLAVCLPRFLDLPFDEKLVTVFHELYHMSQRFDGDLRRHDGRYQYHTHSKKGYDDEMARLVRQYLAGEPDAAALAPLHLTFAQMCAAHGGVLAVRLPRPRMIPVGPTT